MRYVNAAMVLVLASLLTHTAAAEDSASPAAEAIRQAIAKAIPLLEAGSQGSAEQRQCFTCHSQAMPVLALAEVRKRGFAIDQQNFERQVQHTYDHLQRGKQNYLTGQGQGGRAITAGYALWALEAGQRPADETTAAVTLWLLQHQRESARRRHPGSRPPSSGSDFATSYVALRALEKFATDDQQEEFESRKKKLAEWLLAAKPADTEDRVFRLWALAYLAPGTEAVEEAAAELIERQNDDGGWSQTSDMASDAYATGTALTVLHEAYGLAADERARQRGIQYLLDSQLDDGTWHVATRAKPFQTYFESGFPHGKDQFISIAASSWATVALALTLPESP